MTATPSSPRSSARRTRPLTTTVKLTAAAVLIGALVVLGAASSPEHAQASTRSVVQTMASSPSESDFVNRMNALRASLGLGAVTMDGNLVDLARAHTHEMVGTQALVHTTDLTVGMYEPWEKLGENIGFGTNNETLWNAFVASPPHYHNLVDPTYDRVGVASEIDSNGIEWTTHRFMHFGAPVAPTIPVAAPPATAAPAPVTPPPTTVRRPAPTTSPPPVTTAVPVPTSAAPTTTSTSTSTSTSSTTSTTPSPSATELVSSTPSSTGPAMSATDLAPATAMEPAGAGDDPSSSPSLFAKATVLLAMLATIGIAQLILRFAIRPA